jgi:dephospho-CoA kinase
MLKVGLTGNLGSGKSIISRIFEILAIPVYHADDVSKGFLTDRVVREKVFNIFGGKVFSAPDEIDRKALGKVVFSDPELLSRLNAILHPMVHEDFRRWCGLIKDKPYVIQEAAIIYESGFKNEYDRIIHVSCPLEIAIGRAMKRDHTSRDAVLQRVRFQLDNEEKAALSDYVILNDGSQLVIPQVLLIHDELVMLSDRG